jgi:aspartyl aminopeptidase
MAGAGGDEEEEERRIVDGIVEFLNEASTPFHAVKAATDRLRAAGFEQLLEADAWVLKPGAKYFFTRNMTTVVGFAVGGRFDPAAAGTTSRSGFTIIGAHTDSPCPK